ncbi:MAG: hypothetical protein D6759_03430, partial [Chloroflexi bacterium]
MTYKRWITAAIWFLLLAGVGSVATTASSETTPTAISAGTGLTLSETQFGLDTAYTDGRYWKLGGNAGTTPGSDFLGTTDNQALELHVNSTRALRLEPTTGTPNLIGGYSGNSELALPNTTPITGDILTDTVWTLAQSPYLVQTVQVKIAASATLTVEAGVEVIFEQDTGLLVEGNLVAVGTVTQPITFTGSTETPGWWDGIRIQGDIQGDIANLNRGSRFSHVTIAYGGNSYANLVLDDAHATVEQSTILGSGKHGIYTLDEGVVDVQDTRFISNT